jgi:hypothetical protein
MIPKKPVPDVIRGEHHFSGKDHAASSGWSGMTNRREVIPL